MIFFEHLFIYNQLVIVQIVTLLIHVLGYLKNYGWGKRFGNTRNKNGEYPSQDDHRTKDHVTKSFSEAKSIIMGVNYEEILLNKNISPVAKI